MTLKKVPYVELRELSVKITTVKSQICGVTSMDLAFLCPKLVQIH